MSRHSPGVLSLAALGALGLGVAASPHAVAGPSGGMLATLVAQFAVTVIDLPLAEIPSCPQPGIVPGVLSLDTRPWTRLVIDGEPRGSTPMFRERLLPGAHQVELTNENSGIAVREEFVIEAGRSTKVVGRFVTQQAEFAPAPTVAGAADTDSELLPDCAEDLVNPAFLSVNTEPWAQIWVDDKLVGTTPLFRAKIAPGAHRVRMAVGDAGPQVVVDIEARVGELVKLQRKF